MDKRIIYPFGDSVAVLLPCECGLTVEQIAQKDVPEGVPYMIVDASDIPTDRTYRAAWTADFSSPDGHGLSAEEWEALLRATDEPPVQGDEPDRTGLVCDPVLGWVRPEEIPEERR